MTPFVKLNALNRRQDWLEAEVVKCREQLTEIQQSLALNQGEDSEEHSYIPMAPQVVGGLEWQKPLEAAADTSILQEPGVAPQSAHVTPVPPVLTGMESKPIRVVLSSTAPDVASDIETAPPQVPAEVPAPAALHLSPRPPIDRHAPPQPPVFKQIAPTPTATSPEGSFEMRLGTYWLVRIGIVMFLTGLAFFGNYAYQNFIANVGPAGKISMLYLVSTLLLAAGSWWRRKAAKESLKNYGQVLFAGGMAAIYFTTYAAHHVEAVRVIESPLVDGTLLLGWTAFMVWMADRSKQEVLGFFSLGLAYYTSIITRVGDFTLYSNLLLTAASVFFLIRNRWIVLTFASVAATYSGYAYWRFYDGAGWQWASPEAGLWGGICFLGCYWALFTLAVFLSKGDEFKNERRAMFASMNNGMFFALFVLTMMQSRAGGFWKFSMVYGSVLLALAALARKRFPAEAEPAGSYLTQGLLLVTLGVFLKFSGMQRALMLGAESVMLIIMGWQRPSLILRGGGYFVGALATAMGLDGMAHDDTAGGWTGVGLGIFMLVNAWVEHRKQPSPGFRAGPAYFGALMLASWVSVLWNNAAPVNLPLLVITLGVLLTLSIHVLRIREVSLLAQLCVILGNLLPVLMAGWGSAPWWNVASMAALNLVLVHWWQRQRSIPVEAPAPDVFQAIYSLAVVAWVHHWLQGWWPGTSWMVVGGLAAVALTAYGAMTRAGWLAVCAQLFTLESIVQFFGYLAAGRPGWGWPLGPIATMFLLSAGASAWHRFGSPSRPGRAELISQWGCAYRWIGIGMSVWWTLEFVPDEYRVAIFGLISMCLFAWAGYFRSREPVFASLAFILPGLILYWLPVQMVRPAYPADFIIILAVILEQRVARRAPSRYGFADQAHAAYILVGGLSLWLFLSRSILQHASGFYLTASWSVFALAAFGFGLLVRERMYRWFGLGVLACALARVVLIDVWQLDTVFRILSFMALGIVLLILGFFYNKYQERFKEWL